MNNRQTLITAAVTGLLTLGIAAVPAQAADEMEKCWGVAKAGQNACNSNKSRHSCAGHSKIDNDPNDFIPLPKGTCVKIGGNLEPAGDKTATSGKS